MPAWDDLTAFIDGDDFAVEAFIAQAGVTRRVLGIFDNPYLAAEANGYKMDSEEVTLTAIETTLAGIKRGATCSVEGTTYAVLDAPKPDGTGMAVLRLSKEP